MSSDTGRKILSHGAPLILELGLENFTTKKLAQAAGITEATVYKYFQNKHRLLQYYFQLYWTWLEQQVKVFTAIEQDDTQRLVKMVRIIAHIPEVAADPGVISKEVLRQLVINEGTKAYHHVQVDEDNARMFFAPYKQVTKLMAEMIIKLKGEFKHPYSLATTVIEMAHSLAFYQEHLPSLTDHDQLGEENDIEDYLQSILFNTLNINL